MSSRSADPLRTMAAIDLDGHYVESAFSLRLRAVLDVARIARTTHVVAGLPGAGKTMEVEELLRRYPVQRHADGRTDVPIVVGRPVGDARTAKSLAESFIGSFGTVPRSSRRPEWLFDQLARCDTELVIGDDFHIASTAELQFIKQLTDEVLLRCGRRPGIVLLCAGTAAAMPLRETIERNTSQWEQFRRRMSPTAPWQHVASLSEVELGRVLEAYEAIIRGWLPALRLARWSARIHAHLVHPFFALDAGERVTMQNVRNVVGAVVERALSAGLDDIGARDVDAAVERLLAARSTLVVDADPVVTVDADPLLAVG